MLRMLLLVGGIYFSLFVQGQEEQTVTIAPGDTIALKAHSAGARSFIWLRNQEPILDQHDEVLRVSQAGIYTVIALGSVCDSEQSLPVHVLIKDTDPVDPVDPPPTLVDMRIQNLPDRNRVMVGHLVTYQVIAQNKSAQPAHEVLVEIDLPQEVIFEQFTNTYSGTAVYHSAKHQIHWTLPKVDAETIESLNFTIRADEKGLARQVAIVSSLEKDSFDADNRHISELQIMTLRIPNVFTPTGDGINDTFEIEGLTLLKRADLTIFTRDGLEVYRNKNYNNEWAGQGLHAGVYFYLLEVEFSHGKKEVFKGHVSILRN